MAKHKKHRECATPGCHNIVASGSKKGAICGVCRQKLEEVQVVKETEQLDDGKLSERLGKLKL